MEMNRRKFLGSSAAAVVVAGTMAKGKVFGANERVPVAVIGIRGQGNSHIRRLVNFDDAEVVALCDVDQRVLDGRASAVANAQGNAPKKYVDMRDLMADDSVAAVTTATPNHWHTLVGVWACQNGKDAYLEKPMSYDYWESQQIIKAAKKYNRIVQHGTQQRSSTGRIREMKLIHEHKIIGDIYMARGMVYKNGNRHAIGHGVEAPVPDYLNYDLWQGPAQEYPYMATKEDPNEGLFIHYDWHWFWRWGNGEIGNQGVHQMDVACWSIGEKMPVKVQSAGGRYVWDDDGETPNTQATTYMYEDGTMLEFEVRNVGSPDMTGGKNGCTNAAFGTEGYWLAGQGFFEYRENKPIEIPENLEIELPEDRDHIANFINAVKTRNPGDNRCDAEIAQYSCAHISLGNIAYRLGRTLEFDPAKGKFKGAPDADAMLKRDYREPFVIPENV